ncbi:MAG: polysaccharide deacetylase family protein [Bacteroidetes bacterium]|nr:polysaccharide deacetylase family protein [Bacteroidota bacterium]
MKNSGLELRLAAGSAFLFVLILMAGCSKPAGQTEITKWQYGCNGAVSVTYDDGSINQFRKALPIMNRLKMSGTFFINTGSIPGSTYQGKFIGRPVSQIIKEARSIPTGKENFFERASAARYLGYRGTGDYFTRAGAQMDADRPEEAYKIIDELYKKVNSGELQKLSERKRDDERNDVLTWEMIKEYASQGHEFASHMVTHPYVAALDEVNLMYELEKSKEEILNKLGDKYTFSAECPYGSENERAMVYAHKVYPALRNRMPEPFLEELNRSSRKSAVDPGKEYVQWQRGATTKTPLPMMKAWVDTTANQQNIWLVLVIHGIDGIGWEALKSEDVDEYFQYIRSKENELWVATFGDAAKYMRERMNATVKSSENNGTFNVELTHSLDKSMYDLPLTLKTYVKNRWKVVSVKQGDNKKEINTKRDEKGTYVMYQAIPNSSGIEISSF